MQNTRSSGGGNQGTVTQNTYVHVKDSTIEITYMLEETEHQQLSMVIQILSWKVQMK